MPNIWDQKHLQYADAEWIKKPSLFAQWVIQYFPKQGRILDLGAGQGKDSRFFGQKGYEVVSTDYAQEGLKLSRQQLDETLKSHITLQELDLAHPFPYPDNSFDIVYAHLSIHYFDIKTARQIFAEMKRILKAGGILAIMTNSTNDPEYNTGIKLEDDYFEISLGMKKRYFSVDTMRDFAKEFHTIVLDNNGETHKDRRKGASSRFIRFVGKK